MTKLIRYLGLSIESILANKLRASLTMLGIIIGVAAVLSTMGLGAGASANITSSIQSEGTNLLEISSSGEQDQDPPWTFRKIHMHYKIGGKNLTEKAVAQAIQLSEEKYCSVAATIRATAEIITDFEILEESVPEPV